MKCDARGDRLELRTRTKIESRRRKNQNPDGVVKIDRRFRRGLCRQFQAPAWMEKRSDPETAADRCRVQRELISVKGNTRCVAELANVCEDRSTYITRVSCRRRRHVRQNQQDSKSHARSDHGRVHSPQPNMYNQGFPPSLA